MPISNEISRLRLWLVWLGQFINDWVFNNILFLWAHFQAHIYTDKYSRANSSRTDKIGHFKYGKTYK